MAARKGATRAADIHAEVRHALSRGEMQSATLAECLAVNQATLARAVFPDLPVPAEAFGRLRLELGGRTFDVYNTGRHHSHGDLVVHQVEAGILWLSDLAFNQRVTYIGDGHSAEMLAAHAWLGETFTGIRLMVPGHGSAQRAPFPMLAATRAYIEGLRARMQQQLEAGASLQDAVDAAAMPDWAQVPLYEENHRANASFIYRELEFEFF